jgi:hypothetical protein
MLAILIARAKEDGKILDLIPRLVEVGVSILQYADDTIFFHGTGPREGRQHEVDFKYL